MNDFIAAAVLARHVLAGLLVGVGVIGLGVSLVGQLRFPDFFTRLHAGALTAPCAGVVLAGLAVESWNGAIAWRLALLGALLVMLGPLRIQLLANAAHRGGLAPLIGRSAPAPKKKSDR